MHESARRYPGVLVNLDVSLEREFEERPQNASALAFADLAPAPLTVAPIR